MTNSNSH